MEASVLWCCEAGRPSARRRVYAGLVVCFGIAPLTEAADKAHRLRRGPCSAVLRATGRYMLLVRRLAVATPTVLLRNVRATSTMASSSSSSYLDKVTELVKSNEIMVFSKTYCP